ncbi:MAG: hybrid sensor histidine kinase/response regulator [Campylobacterota bacterium]|nr:hybrid sensor histidine kinase/response regulator [Campylobacterota bacterium]
MNDLHISKILVVDDNDDNLELIEDFLDDDGYENIICVLGAKEAYDVLDNNNIDLIILDIMMPEIDGLEACEYIKTNPEYKDIPIIIATAKADLDTLKAGFDAGANDYVRKPITNDVELLARVRNALTLKCQLDYIKNTNECLDKKVKYEIEKNHKKDLLMQEQTKLAAIGEMVGSIAHQWRQPLNALSINIQNLEDDFQDGLIDKLFVDEFMEKNRKIIDFMSSTIDDFRNFFRIDKEKIDFSILESVNDVISIQNAVIRSYNITIDIIGEDFNINGYKNEFSQVIMNLINNAKDALVEKKIKDKKIVIKIETRKIKIEDNAGGIDEKIINRVFEPYFTTKEQGKGTGMGLYMSKMIIENNMGGILNVKNIDNGVSFEIIMSNKV